MREVTIFRDMITETRLCERDYIEEVWQYPVETFAWNEADPKSYHKDWEGDGYIRHEFHYVATKQFKEKFKIFFDAYESLKDEIATKEYLLKVEKQYHNDCLQELLDVSYKLREFESMTFWERLVFLFKGRNMK